MKIFDYEFNLTEQQLDDIIQNQMRTIELISPEFNNYANLPEGDKKALKHLVAAANIINDVALEQDHPLNVKIKGRLEALAKESPYAAKMYTLFKSFNGIAGHNGIDPEPILLFKNTRYLEGKNFYPEDLTPAEFHQIILRMAERGKIDELRRILSARTMVRREGDELKAIDYTEYFAYYFSRIANELEVAAHYCTEPEFKDYLNWQAQALLQNNPDMDMLADKHWALLQNNKLEFTISRENYEDEMTATVFDNPDVIAVIGKYNLDVVSKDTLGCRVGIVNLEETEKILVSKKTLPHLAQWMPFSDSYEQQNVDAKHLKQAMGDVDLIALTGDYAMCRGGVTTAQNLPNNDKLAVKTGGGRRNVYHRQVRLSQDENRRKLLREKLLAPELHQYVDHTKVIIFVVGHENGHSLGPDSSYQNALGMYKHIIEEHKANVVSIASMAEIAQTWQIFDAEELKKIYTSWIVGNLFLRAEPILLKPHRVADLIEFNYLLENGSIWFDEDKKLHINFEGFDQVMYRLLAETINVQLSKSVDQARSFIERWAVWGEWPQYIAKIQEEIGIKPYIKLVTHF